MQRGANYTEEIPLFTLSGSKAAATLAVSEKWLQKLEKQYVAEASTSSKALSTSESSRDLASGDAILSWLYDQDLGLPCTQHLSGRAPDTLRLPELAPCVECVKEHFTLLCMLKSVTAVI